jgi:hypothetical protein
MLFAPLKAIGKELPEIFGAQITASGVPDSGSHYMVSWGFFAMFAFSLAFV